jgi:hypothetical protein
MRRDEKGHDPSFIIIIFPITEIMGCPGSMWREIFVHVEMLQSKYASIAPADKGC